MIENTGGAAQAADGTRPVDGWTFWIPSDGIEVDRTRRSRSQNVSGTAISTQPSSAIRAAPVVRGSSGDGAPAQAVHTHATAAASATVADWGHRLVKRALARTAILSNEKFRGVRLSLENGKLTLQTHNPEHEEAEEDLEVEYQGAALEIGFNVNYLLDALSALDSAKFVMELKNADSSGLIHADGDASSKYVVMPMRL